MKKGKLINFLKFDLKNGFLFLCAIFLCGCGEESEVFSKSKTVKVGFDNYVFEYFLPTNWQKNESTEFAGASLGSENFVITRYELPKGELKEVMRYFFDEAKNQFFYFEEVYFNEDEWVFRAKKAVDSPLREFWQKVVLVPNGTSFLLGSCSFESMVNENNDCQTILKRFSLVL